MMAVVDALCEEVTARNYLFHIATNRELAAKYCISERTVRNWRREGCPFAEGQWHVLAWIAARRYAPAGTEAKFEKQLGRRRWKRGSAITLKHVAELQQMAWLCRKHRCEVPDCLRGIRPRRGKVPFYDSETCKPLETSLNYRRQTGTVEGVARQ